jgi:hypothetical protein
MKRNITLVTLTILALGVMLQAEAGSMRKGKWITSPTKARSAVTQDRAARKEATTAATAITLIDQEKTLLEAVRNQDYRAVGGMLAPGAFMANARAANKSAAFFLDSLEQKMLTVNSVDIKEMKVTMVNSSTALVTYYAKVDGSYFGAPFGDDWHYSSTCWTLTRGGWQVVYHQDTNLKYTPSVAW